jgi:hypothetical protein
MAPGARLALRKGLTLALRLGMVHCFLVLKIPLVIVVFWLLVYKNKEALGGGV